MKNARTSGSLAMAILGFVANSIHPAALGHAREIMSLTPRIMPRKRYPEQSKRQQNRRFRRAQGGPGLDANNDPRI